MRQLVENSPQAFASIPAVTSVGVAAGLVLISNSKRKGFLIQNTGTTIIKLAFGSASSAPTQTVYHIALKDCAAANDGSGGVYVDDAWTGDVWAISSAGGGTCVICEFKTGSPDWNAAMDWGV